MTGRPAPPGGRSRHTWATVLSFAVAIGLLLALVFVVGADRIVASVRVADPIPLGGLVVVVCCWIVVWSGSLWLVLRAFDLPAPPVRTGLAYTCLMFWDNVTPVSTVVADPIAAGVLARAFDVEYERSLAVVVTVDFLNFAPAPIFAVVGLLLAVSTLVVGTVVERVAVPLLAGLVLVGVGAVLLWRSRRRLGSALGSLVGRVEWGLRRRAPWLARHRRVTAFRRRVATFLDQLDTIAARRRTVVATFSLAVFGWGLLSLALWLSLYAVGVVVPVAVALFAIPLVTVIELLPLPGGVGGLEPLLVLVLVSTTGGTPPTVTAGVLVFRLGTHVLPTVVGGAAHPLLVAR